MESSQSKIFEDKLDEIITLSFPRGARLAMIFGWISFIIVLAAYLFGMKTMMLQLVFLFAICIYASLICFLSGRRILKGRNMRFVLIIPMFTPTIFFIIANVLMPERILYNLTGPFSFSYFLIIIMTCLFFNHRYSVLTGFISGIGYFLSYLLARDNLHLAVSLSKEKVDMMFSPAAFIAKSMMMVFSGYLVGVGIKIARMLVSRILDEEQQKHHITNTFGMIVDPRVRDLMIDKKLETGGETKENTVLFADIRGFTTFSQEMRPPELFDFMKEYFDLLNAEIKEEDGTILEYVGDEIMVLFGAPLPLANHAEKACIAALRIQDAIRRQNPVWMNKKLPSIKAGAGIHTGQMLVGCIGSSERHKYGALGDSVNLASRLQSLTKEYGVSIIASEDTVKQCDGKLFTRRLDRVIVRGRTEEVIIHEVISRSDTDQESQKRDFVRTYERAFSSYISGNLPESLALFRQAQAMTPDDPATRRFIERIECSLS